MDKEKPSGSLKSLEFAVLKKDSHKGPVSYIAAKGHSFPIFYKGSIIRIGDTEPAEIDLLYFGYEALAQFQRALDKKQILEVGA